MPATRDGKLWRSQFYYKDWQGVRRKKNKRGFKTKGEADECFDLQNHSWNMKWFGG